MWSGKDARIQVKRSLNYFKCHGLCPWVSTPVLINLTVADANAAVCNSLSIDGTANSKAYLNITGGSLTIINDFRI